MYGHLHSLQDPHKVVLNTRSKSQFTVNIYSLNPCLKAIITINIAVSVCCCVDRQTPKAYSGLIFKL